MPYIPNTEVGFLTTRQMVFNRLGFLVDSQNQIIDDFIWEVMNELEPCFKIAENGGTVGNEADYTVAQLSAVADLVAVYVILLIAATNAQGVAGATATGVRFLKKAKAGSAEVEWGELNISSSNVIGLGGDKMLNYYKLSASRRVRNFGCVLDICDDCVGMQTGVLPFITVGGCGCGC